VTGLLVGTGCGGIFLVFFGKTVLILAGIFGISFG
jgi:hypothetical protein